MLPPIPFIALAGPTASGKSALALALARRLPAEIISVDSALVYRGMDIGTAKPTAAERRLVPHHLIDIRAPHEPYSAADFVRDARRLMAEIRARGRLPLLVGGTMMYFHALLHGLDALPAADAAVRQRIEARAARCGWAALHRILSRIDPQAAARIAPQDSQRIGRALEVWLLTGRPLSALQKRQGEQGAQGEQGGVLCALEPHRRAWLHARIAARFDAMLAAGFVDEVRRLRARGDLSPALPSMRCVGYRQAWQALDEGRDAAWLREKACAATRQLAKRQLTWLRAMPQRRSICVDEGSTAEGLAGEVVRALKSVYPSV